MNYSIKPDKSVLLLTAMPYHIAWIDPLNFYDSMSCPFHRLSYLFPVSLPFISWHFVAKRSCTGKSQAAKMYWRKKSYDQSIYMRHTTTFTACWQTIRLTTTMNHNILFTHFTCPFSSDATLLIHPAAALIVTKELCTLNPVTTSKYSCYLFKNANEILNTISKKSTGVQVSSLSSKV